MQKFPLTPPANETGDALASKTFKGGMMPPAKNRGVSMIVLDIKSLKLTLEEGKELEEEIRAVVVKRLSKKVKNFQDLSVADLHTTVLGISFD